MDRFLEGLGAIEPVDDASAARARSRQVTLTKPLGSLGRLEDIACQLCAIQAVPAPSVTKPQVLLFAADHGFTEAEAVAPYPREVTRQMVANIARGGAAINAFARAVGAEIDLVDVGVDGAPSSFPDLAPGVRYTHAPVSRGSRSFLVSAAMSRVEAGRALAIGAEAVERAEARGATVVVLGEMGIGNTTSAAAVTAGLTRCDVSEAVGRGTGADDAMLLRKRDLVERAVRLHCQADCDPLELLRRVGGFELMAMVGACFRAARARIAVVADGFITTAAVAVAVRLSPNLRGYVFAGHLSPERGHAVLLRHLDLVPLLDLGMRLGEGTGAALALPVLRAAAAAFNEMATFSEAAVSGRR